MNTIELSFCIPTYNREQSVSRLVTDILLCDDPSIEIVVLDNGSTDDTLSVLHSIKDDRLSIYSNGENKGALYNMVNVLNRGKGQYLVYSTDQDYIDSRKIKQFKSFLMQHAGLVCGFCEFDTFPEEKPSELFPKGYESIKKIAYKGRHPTGYFFNNKCLRSIKIVERFSDYDFVDLFPLEFVFAELCLMGNGAIYHGSIFKPETGVNVVTHKSSTTNGRSKKAFFSPETRLKLAINYSKHINTLQIEPRERDLLILDTFIAGLAAATFGYKSILRNNNLCIHYFMDSRNMKYKELIIIGHNFYRRYTCSNTGLWGNSFVKLFKFKTALFFRLLQKALIRLFAH